MLAFSAAQTKNPGVVLIVARGSRSTLARMSLWDRITHAVGKDMDEKVAAPGGTSAQRYSALVAEDELYVRASVSNATKARIELSGPGEASTLPSDRSQSLGLGKEHIGQQLRVVAHVDAAIDPAALVVLRVEVFTLAPGAAASERNGVETYSVEARLDPETSAMLELQLQLG